MPVSPAVVLIGPAAAGKSTLGLLVAEELGLEFVDLDEIGEAYYLEVGWSIDRLIHRSAEVGRVAAEREWEPARAHAVQRAVAEHPGTVLALGAGHTSFIDATCFARVCAALAAVDHVVLVLPEAGRDAGLAELRERSVATKGTDWIRSGHDFLAEWFDDAGTRSLATHVVYTEGESPQATAARLVSDLLASNNTTRTAGA